MIAKSDANTRPSTRISQFLYTYSTMKGPPTGVAIIIWLFNQATFLFMHCVKSTNTCECIEHESINTNTSTLQIESRLVTALCKRPWLDDLGASSLPPLNRGPLDISDPCGYTLLGHSSHSCPICP